jgi:hypothetical protein
MMNDKPTPHLRTGKHITFLHWSPDKLYPIKSGDTVTDDDGGKYYASKLPQLIGSHFKLVWVWPDGTELEALE